MSNQICYALFSIWTTLSTRFKTEKSYKGGVNHNITKGTSVYFGSPYMMSRDQLYYVMTSSDSHGVNFILSWTYASKRRTIIYSFMINLFFGIWLVSELFDPPTYMPSGSLGGTKHIVFPQMMSNTTNFIMTSFRRHICPPLFQHQSCRYPETVNGNKIWKVIISIKITKLVTLVWAYSTLFGLHWKIN